ncbi:aldehyde dehydrogenase family protein [Nonomuraea sp. NPDC026600]|uniref:aldehyde dehydrogenase family protein n=1 Tax=Nonomuraea sp. NPDC026600 TaxID=3155363 RepID=UPI003409F09B
MTIAQAVHDRADAFVRSPHKLLIGGRWIEAAAGETFATVDPATEKVLAEVGRGRAEDVDRAVRAARAAFADGSPWRRMTPSARGRLLWRIGDLLEEHVDELAMLETLDNGKPYTIALGDVRGAADLFRYMAGWPTKIEGATVPISSLAMPGEYLAYTQREPVGVVGQIIPWNYPLLMASWKLAPALACGCTVVLKPAEQTPLTALRLGQLLQEAGLPDGVVNIVTGFGDTGAALTAHADVDKVAFTGSTEVGKKIVEAAAGNLKRLTLELGGKSPIVVHADADLENAAVHAAGAIFYNQGQSCTAGSLLYVHRSVFDDVVGRVAEEAARLKVAPGTDPGADLGPLVSHEQFAKVLGYVDSGRAQGAEVVVGGHRVGDRGFFVEPTVLTNTTPGMSVVREEIFGPVVCAMPFDSLEEIVASANDTRFGLAAGVFTRDLSKAHRTARLLRAGTVWINTTYHVFDAAMPFGGYKESGWGREMGSQVLDNYLETKSVVTAL